MKPLHRLALSISVTVFAFASMASVHAAQSGEEILNNQCAACHTKGNDGRLARIDEARKTPEAWDMTVVRMMRNHGVQLTPEQRRNVVRHLAETRGLSFEETEGFRYILEREPVATDEAPSQLLAETCARCHSFARVALQRRTPEEWEKLVHFHLGQFATLELQALARDRDWWAVANQDVIPALSEAFPLGEAPEPFQGDLSGEWVVAGHAPGKGHYSGVMSISDEGAQYRVQLDMNFEEGRETYSGPAILHGAAEWRATVTNDLSTLRQVFGLSPDGTLEGRWFDKDAEVIGGRLQAVRTDSPSRILAVSPAYLKVGETARVRITGSNLQGDLSLPEGISGKVVSRSGQQVVVEATADKPLGRIDVRVGNASAQLVAFDHLDRVAVEPSVTISRVGGNGGPIPKVPAQFEAVGYLNGPDDEPGTSDDVRVGYFPASWAVDNWNETAAQMEDAKYAGEIDQNGLFTPAGAGPNPERFMSANNIGDLKVLASVKDGERILLGEAHLYATVQRFVDPPIR